MITQREKGPPTPVTSEVLGRIQSCVDITCGGHWVHFSIVITWLLPERALGRPSLVTEQSWRAERNLRTVPTQAYKRPHNPDTGIQTPSIQDWGLFRIGFKPTPSVIQNMRLPNIFSEAVEGYRETQSCCLRISALFMTYLLKWLPWCCANQNLVSGWSNSQWIY